MLLKSKYSISCEYSLLIAIMLFSIALRMLWFRTTIEGDEGMYGYYAMMWHRGYTLYVDLPAQRLPLQYLLYMIPIHFFGNSIVAVRMLNNILFLISIVALYLIVKDWFGKRTGLITALFYGIFMNAPAFQAQMAMNESFSIPFVIFSIFSCNKYSKNLNRRHLLIAGTFIAAALLIRWIQGIGIILLVMMVAVARHDFHKESLQTRLSFAKNFTADLLILTIGMLTSILAFVFYFWSHGALQALIEHAILRFLPGGSYYSQPNVEFGVKFLAVAEGLPLWLFAFFGLIECILRSDKYGWYAMPTVLWLLLFLCVASVPPNLAHHYSVIIAPASLLAGIALSSILDRIKPRSVRGLRVEFRQNVTSIFLFALLILSFMPSIFLQVKQYPDTTIDWEFVRWYPGGDMGITSYGQQLQIVQYLKTNTPKGEQNLVYDWANYIPWLAGQEIPRAYLMKDLDPEGPEAGLQKVANMVREKSFEYIVLFSPSFGILRTKSDPVMDATLDNYFYIKSIGGAHIFSRYNTRAGMP